MTTLSKCLTITNCPLAFSKVTDLQKLEYIHSAILDAGDLLAKLEGHRDPELDKALEFVEDLRELYFEDDEDD